jgi:endo-1,4-beta-xylanase
MKPQNDFHHKGILLLFPVLMLQSLLLMETDAQYPGIDDDILQHRTGELVIKAAPGSSVTVEQLSHEFWFGCAISSGFVDGSFSGEDQRQYSEKFLENFNSAVTENAVKWGNMERRKGEVDYTVVDGILQWAEENHIPLRGHNLFWGIPRFIQPWVKELDDDELRQALQQRAETVTGRYAGRFAEYDLNNEMIHGNYYEDRLGPEITKLMAEWALQGDPGARLWLNDYDILTGNQLGRYMAHIRELLSQGVPVAGIGVQGHLHGERFDRDQLRIALDSLAVFNLPIRITEFNMPGQRSAFYENRKQKLTDGQERLKAAELADYYRICFAHPAVEGILMWGFWEGANWIPASSLYRRDWSPTPAAGAYRDLVYGQWWTREEGESGRNGEFSTRAFFGKYRVSAAGVTREVDLSKANGRVVVDLRN